MRLAIRTSFRQCSGRILRKGRTVAMLAVAAMLTFTTAGCSLFGDDPPPPVIGDYVTGIQVLGDPDARTELVDRQLEAGNADGPQADVEDSSTVVNGGSVQQNVTSDVAFRVVRVAIEELPVPSADPDATEEPTPTSTGAPAGGYHEVTLSEDATEATVVMTIAQQLPGQRFVLYYAIADASGTQGPLATQDVQAVGVGTGDVQVSVSWDVDSDVDLYVIDPAGEEIYFANKVADSGGELDLDSNADCFIDGVRNENITWEQAPPGTYTVRVDLYKSCDVTPSNYVVTVQLAGQPTRTYTGTLTGNGDLGDGGVEIATFEVTGATAG
jgi:hypothetical protein